MQPRVRRALLWVAAFVVLSGCAGSSELPWHRPIDPDGRLTLTHVTARISLAAWDVDEMTAAAEAAGFSVASDRPDSVVSPRLDGRQFVALLDGDGATVKVLFSTPGHHDLRFDDLPPLLANLSAEHGAEAERVFAIVERETGLHRMSNVTWQPETTRPQASVAPSR